VVANLKEVRNDVSADTERLAGKLHAELQFARIDDILEQRPARHPDALPGGHLRTGQPGQPRFPRAAGSIETPHDPVYPPRNHCYRYTRRMAYTIQQLHLTPRAEPQQHVLSWNIATPGHCTTTSTPTATCRTS
jgi:hypothetical protein